MIKIRCPSPKAAISIPRLLCIRSEIFHVYTGFRFCPHSLGIYYTKFVHLAFFSQQYN